MAVSLRFLCVCLLTFSSLLHADFPANYTKYLAMLEPVFAHKPILSRGEVCEVLAAHEIVNKFPNADVLTQVRYSPANDTNSLLGELDLVVLAKGSPLIIGIGEVKCSSNLRHARIRADTQLTRVRNSVNTILNALAKASCLNFSWETATIAEVERVSGYSFFLVNPGILEPAKLDFSSNIEFFKVSQKADNASLHGFTQLELTLPQIDTLTEKLAKRLRKKGIGPHHVTF